MGFGLGRSYQQVLSGVAAAAVLADRTATLTGGGEYARHQIVCQAVGGEWTFATQHSPDGGTTWAAAAAALVVAAGTADTIYLEGIYPNGLRVVATPTAGGTASCWHGAYKDAASANIY